MRAASFGMVTGDGFGHMVAISNDGAFLIAGGFGGYSAGRDTIKTILFKRQANGAYSLFKTIATGSGVGVCITATPDMKKIFVSYRRVSYPFTGYITVYKATDDTLTDWTLFQTIGSGLPNAYSYNYPSDSFGMYSRVTSDGRYLLASTSSYQAQTANIPTSVQVLKLNDAETAYVLERSLYSGTDDMACSGDGAYILIGFPSDTWDGLYRSAGSVYVYG